MINIDNAIAVGSYVAVGMVCFAVMRQTWPAVTQIEFTWHGLRWPVFSITMAPALQGAAFLFFLALGLFVDKEKWLVWWLAPWLEWIAPADDIRAVFQAWPGVVVSMSLIIGSMIGMLDAICKMIGREHVGRWLLLIASVSWPLVTGALLAFDWLV